LVAVGLVVLEQECFRVTMAQKGMILFLEQLLQQVAVLVRGFLLDQLAVVVDQVAVV
jgi:hypothetical protein